MIPEAEVPGREREPESRAERLGYYQYASAELVATALPEPVGRRLFAWTAALQHRSPERRRPVETNLSRVLGLPRESAAVRAAVREAFDSYARYWHDTFRLRVLPPEEVRKRFQMRGIEHIDAALEQGKGAILALPHMGNWDAAGHYMAINGYRLTAVAEVLRPRRLADLFVRHREALGMGIVPLQEMKKVGEELVRRLSENVLIALVCDRDLRGTGPEVEMFGATRRMPAGPALLSLGTGSPLLPSSVYDTEDGWLCVVDPPLEIERTDELRADVATLTRMLARHFERAIAAAPTQWHMFQPAWPGGSGGVARRRASERGTSPASEPPGKNEGSEEIS